MHGLKTIDALHNDLESNKALAAENGYASHRIERNDIVFIAYGGQSGVVYTNAKGCDFIEHNLPDAQKLGPIRLIAHDDVGSFITAARNAGLTI